MGGGPSQSTINTQNQIAQEQVGVAQQNQANANQLFNLSYPGIQTAEKYYSTLASGNQQAIQNAVAPAEQDIAAQSQAAKQNIQATAPRGGEKLLALQEADIQKSSDIGKLMSQAYESSFPALATMGGQNIGLSVNQMANAIAGLGGASNTTGQVANEQAAGKATTMGFIGSLTGAGAAGLGAALG